jgi:hypothetical protein
MTLVNGISYRMNTCFKTVQFLPRQSSIPDEKPLARRGRSNLVLFVGREVCQERCEITGSLSG